MGWKWRRDTGSLLLVVIVIIVVAVVVIALRPTVKRPLELSRTFRVSTVTHEGRQRFAVDGEVGKTLSLARGRKYRVELDASAHPLYLTTSEVGGAGMPGAIGTDSARGPLVGPGGFAEVVTDSATLPGTLYYQSARAERVGGRVVLL